MNRSRRSICAPICAGSELPAETAKYLQRRFPRDMRTLCDVLDTLDDAAFAAQRRPDGAVHPRDRRQAVAGNWGQALISSTPENAQGTLVEIRA